MKKNLIIFILLILVISLGIFTVKELLNDNKKHVEKSIVDTFLYDFRDGYDYSSGAAQLYGYVEVENRSDYSSGDSYKYVTFNILESNSENFMKYLESNADGTYISKDSIGLGCLIDGRITLKNYSDVYDVEGAINTIKQTEVDYGGLLSSTKDNPVKLNIIKYLNTRYYSYHPVCESMLSIFLTPTK
jgi:hypothetical protein